MLDIGFDIGHSSTVVTVFRVGLSLRHALEKENTVPELRNFYVVGKAIICDVIGQ